MSNANDAARQKKWSRLLWCILRRFFLCLFTAVVLAAAALALMLNLVFTGPSPSARDELTIILSRASVTQWIPGVFLGENTVNEILSSAVPAYPDNTGS